MVLFFRVLSSNYGTIVANSPKKSWATVLDWKKVIFGLLDYSLGYMSLS